MIKYQCESADGKAKGTYLEVSAAEADEQLPAAMCFYINEEFASLDRDAVAALVGQLSSWLARTAVVVEARP